MNENENEIVVQVQDLRKGDRFYDDRGYLHWTATGDAERADTVIVVPVLYGDGGRGTRTWSTADASWLLTVTREEAS